MSDMTPEELEAYENRLRAWRQAMIHKHVNQNWMFSDVSSNYSSANWEEEEEDSSPEPEKPKREIEAIEELEYDMLRWEIMNGRADKV